MIADFLEPMAGLSFVRSQIWIGNNKISNIKILNDESFTVVGKKTPKPKMNSIKPIT